MSFTQRIRVRYGECDMQSVVFNADYLAYIDDTLDSWFRSALGDFEELGFDFMVKKITLEWQTPARFGDEIDLTARVSRWGNTSFDAEVIVTVGELPALTALLVYVSTTPGAPTPTPIPPAVRDALESVATGVRLRRLPRRFYQRDSRTVAPELLNKVLVAGPCRGRIVEVEAYAGGEDPASHVYRGRTARNATMFEQAGLLYVYFTYGMHWCANVVTGDDGQGQAVLLRAVAPLAGLDEMRARRPAARTDRDLTCGPARLCQAFGVTGADDGTDVVRDAHLWLGDDATAPPTEPAVSRRIGLTKGTEPPWRWFVAGDPYVSGRH